jgi:hypothetical protein
MDRNKHCLRKKGWRKIYQVNDPWKQEVVTHISEKVDFKPKLVRRDKEGYFIIIKGAIQQEEITIINVYAPNIDAPNFIKHTPIDLKT